MNKHIIFSFIVTFTAAAHGMEHNTPSSPNPIYLAARRFNELYKQNQSTQKKPISKKIDPNDLSCLESSNLFVVQKSKL